LKTTCEWIIIEQHFTEQYDGEILADDLKEMLDGYGFELLDESRTAHEENNALYGKRSAYA